MHDPKSTLSISWQRVLTHKVCDVGFAHSASRIDPYLSVEVKLQLSNLRREQPPNGSFYKLEGPTLRSSCEGSYCFGSTLSAPDFWKLPNRQIPQIAGSRALPARVRKDC